MIELIKLGKVHQMLNDTDYHCTLSIGLGIAIYKLYKLDDCDYKHVDDFYTIDCLIEKVETIVRDICKFEIGQTVYMAGWFEVDEFVIEDITGDPPKLWTKGSCFYQDECFSKKSDAIEYAISMWKKQRCDHESNGRSILDAPYNFECKKCGELYK